MEYGPVSHISIHASREGSDFFIFGLPSFRIISIHASREGSDAMFSRLSSGDWLFQSTLPAREATKTIAGIGSTAVFQSTLPAREATEADSAVLLPGRNFNPRFPRGKRPHCLLTVMLLLKFQSTLPAREATSRPSGGAFLLVISIHASREGSDPVHSMLRPAACLFQSTLPAREAT